MEDLLYVCVFLHVWSLLPAWLGRCLSVLISACPSYLVSMIVYCLHLSVCIRRFLISSMCVFFCMYVYVWFLYLFLLASVFLYLSSPVCLEVRVGVSLSVLCMLLQAFRVHSPMSLFPVSVHLYLPVFVVSLVLPSP